MNMILENFHGNVLVVDDQKPVCHLLKSILEKKFGQKVHIAYSGTEALEKFAAHKFDIVLTDVVMPDFSGFSLLEEIQKRDPSVPVILLTGHYEVEDVKKAIKLGAYDFITKPFDPTEILLSFSRSIERRRLIKENLAYQEKLESMVDSRTKELQAALMKLEDVFLEKKKAHLESIIVLSKIVECNDEVTGNHIKRISRYSEVLSSTMGFSPEFVEEITYSSPMHDIGKILINPAILKKPGKLTIQEFEEMKLHTIYGSQILDGIPFLQMAKDIAFGHHEKYDGGGYPNGFAGEQIPISARIVTICDVFDALVSKRSYKKEFSLGTAASIIKSEVGTAFDPQVAKAFFEIKDDLYKIYLELKDNI